jgi:predicted transglutaminase-like cysteine proteinase
VQFCADNPDQCGGGKTQARDVVMTQTAWRDLQKVNHWVNEKIKPMTDMDHWGVVEKWSIPTDGYGDCEDYALLKRKMLIDAGWPREALLMTVVRDKQGEGHAVLTVKTDRGEFILDNENENVVAWTETGYRYVKRQSQSDPDVWVSLGDVNPAIATASAR